MGHPEELRRGIEDTFNRVSRRRAGCGSRSHRTTAAARTDSPQKLWVLVRSSPCSATTPLTKLWSTDPRMIYIERDGKIERVPRAFDSEMHVYRIIDRIVAPLGRRVDEGQPFVDARLPDGSRVNVIIPTARAERSNDYDSKICQDAIDCRGPDQAHGVHGRVYRIYQGMRQGTTQYRSHRAAPAPARRPCSMCFRVIFPTTSASSRSRMPPSCSCARSMSSRWNLAPRTLKGKGEITRGDLVINALRMRPDRIIVGECRSSEALDMLQAMNTGSRRFDDHGACQLARVTRCIVWKQWS